MNRNSKPASSASGGHDLCLVRVPRREGTEVRSGCGTSNGQPRATEKATIRVVSGTSTTRP